jgi:hypothetical protein
MEQLKIGDFGRFVFTLRARKIIAGPHDISGAEIIDMDRSHIMIRDLQGVEYMPRRIDIREFIPLQKVYILKCSNCRAEFKSAEPDMNICPSCYV